ncbi:hypothetical protein [Chthonobacter rhizosphaerae]|uniref:hypothetical protein n=1 Tax=Chthonobacter rhizosphaerae TaxID=2735553 RepID=UPI0015EEDA5F|nr:hypothetical protein [Chthonobacter rhizosphaerae]
MADEPKTTTERGPGDDRNRKGPPEPGREPAGPHADPTLIDPDKTPGTGALPPADGTADQDSNSG